MTDKIETQKQQAERHFDTWAAWAHNNDLRLDGLKLDYGRYFQDIFTHMVEDRREGLAAMTQMDVQSGRQVNMLNALHTQANQHHNERYGWHMNEVDRITRDAKKLEAGRNGMLAAIMIRPVIELAIFIVLCIGVFGR